MKSLLKLSGIWMILLLMFCSIQTIAQDWSPIQSTDTSYYFHYEPNGVPLKLGSGFIPDLMSGRGIPNVVWIQSSSALGGGNSMNYFQPAVPTPLGMVCIDTAGPTIFGKGFLRTNSGSVYFFNSAGDSLRIDPDAPLNATWLFYNKAGLKFQATVSAMDTQTVNGLLDSVKLVSLSIIQGVPFSPYYANLYFCLSKHYGILESFSFDRFLADTYLDTYFKLDSNQYHTSKSEMDFAIEKYQAGNYWIYRIDSFYVGGTYYNYTNSFQDSVIASTILLPDQIQYTIKRHRNGIDSIITATESFSTLPINYLKAVYPGYYNNTQTFDLLDALKNFNFYQLADSSIVVCCTTYSNDIVYDSCWHAMIGLTNYETTTQCVSNYFKNFATQSFKIWTAIPGIYENIAQAIVFYKIGTHIYSPSFEVGTHSIELSGEYKSNQDVFLNWITTNEKNTFGFEIQRSLDHNHFETIEQMPAAGHSEGERNYSYIDHINPMVSPRNVMYRILVRDVDGHTSYSNSINIEMKSLSEFSVYPNPFGSQLNIQLNTLPQGDLNIRLLDMKGRIVFAQTILSANAQQINSIQVPKDLNSGIYFLQLKNEQGGLNEMIRVEKIQAK